MDQVQLETIVAKAANGYGMFDASRIPEGLREELFLDPFDLFKNRTEERFSEWSQVAPDRGLGHLDVCLSASPKVNAAAIRVHDHSIVVVNAGTLVRLKQLINFTVNDEQVFPPVADDPDIAPLDRLSFGVEPADILSAPDLDRSVDDPNYDFSPLGAPIPRTLRRYELAKWMMCIAIDFISCHETAHLAHRHDRHVRTTGPTVLREAPEPDDTRDRQVDDLSARHRAELQADMAAVTLVSPTYLSEDFVEVLSPWAGGRRDAVRIWLLTLSLVFFLFDSWSEVGRQTGTHPHPALRVAMAIISTANVFYGGEMPPPDEPQMSDGYFDGLMMWMRYDLPLDRVEPFLEFDPWLSRAAEIYHEVYSSFRNG